MQRQHTRILTKGIGVIIAGSLISLLLIMLFPLGSLAAHHIVSETAKSTYVLQAQDTPTVTDPTVTALQKEQLAQQVMQLKNANDSSWTALVTLFSTLFSALALIIAGIFGAIRWFNDRSIEREKRSEERFLSVVKDLGGEREEMKVGAAIMLRTFLRPDYEQFYGQSFDLAVANLRLRKAAPNAGGDPKTPVLLTPLAQALVVVFREAFPLARDFLKRDQRYFNAAEIPLDYAYLSEADLKTIWMPSASLQKAIMNRVNLSGALLSDAIFTEAELKGAKLAGALLRRANFSHANLTNADLSQAKLRGAIFVGANLSGVDLSGAELPQANLAQTNIEQTKSLLNAKLYGVTGLTVEQQNICVAKGAVIDEKSALANQPAISD